MATLADVARAVGIAPSTASRALNRPELVRPEVVERVHAAAERLGYAPNPFARSLRWRDSRTLGLIVPDNTNPFFAEVARGIEEACFRAGYTLMLCNSDQSLEKEAAQARALYGKRVDGVLMFNASDASAATIKWLIERDVPVVLVERRLAVRGADCVISDNRNGVREAMIHLKDSGHRRIACLLRDPGVSHYRERLEAYIAAGRELQLEDLRDLVRTGLSTYADGQWAATELLTGDNPPSALLCLSDTLALGALRGATLARRRVPQDVAVVGFGNTEMSAYTQPPLTSVGQERLAVGSAAVRLLLERIKKPFSASRTPRSRIRIIPTRLVVRESSAMHSETAVVALNPVES
ncbi:MAG: LacI family DNA-binding transcriptional regulator [Chloroflexi bacterium]|nr:LacI family DNA-binding transcriptional regulator [Chloroflexota bacterium]